MGKLKSKLAIVKENLAKGLEVVKQLVKEWDGLKYILKKVTSKEKNSRSLIKDPERVPWGCPSLLKEVEGRIVNP